MRLIDADALLDKLKIRDLPIRLTWEIQTAPAIDAVPVVRCRECIHRKKYQADEQQGDTICTLDWNIRKLDWYCADGQRRQDVTFEGVEFEDGEA